MTELNVEQARFNMIEQQIRPWNVLSEQVLETMSEIPRERFVPEKYASLAFTDVQIPLGDNQFMMEPRLEGRLLESLSIKPTDKILEIGTGSGFVTACLAKLGAEVTTVEINKSLQDHAKKTLHSLHIDNVTFSNGDGANGWSDKEQFDVIAITGSLPKYHNGFESCLTVGGRLFVICGTDPVMEAKLVRRIREDVWDTESLFDTEVAALKNAPVPPPFSL